MTYKVRLWVEDNVVKCCSGVCTEISCPRVGVCKETEIEEVEEEQSDYLRREQEHLRGQFLQRYGVK